MSKPSIEIRQTPDGKDLECCWGVICHGDPRPDRRNPDGTVHVDSLMLCTVEYAIRLAAEGPIPYGSTGAIHSVTREGERLFAHVTHPNGSWTWELFNAHWWDDHPCDPILIGRWPD